jgi:hypothetical protein
VNDTSKDTLTAWRKHHTMFRHGLAQFLSSGIGFFQGVNPN